MTKYNQSNNTNFLCRQRKLRRETSIENFFDQATITAPLHQPWDARTSARDRRDGVRSEWNRGECGWVGPARRVDERSTDGPLTHRASACVVPPDRIANCCHCILMRGNVHELAVFVVMLQRRSSAEEAATGSGRRAAVHAEREGSRCAAHAAARAAAGRPWADQAAAAGAAEAGKGAAEGRTSVFLCRRSRFVWPAQEEIRRSSRRGGGGRTRAGHLQPDATGRSRHRVRFWRVRRHRDSAGRGAGLGHDRPVLLRVAHLPAVHRKLLPQLFREEAALHFTSRYHQ